MTIKILNYPLCVDIIGYVLIICILHAKCTVPHRPTSGGYDRRFGPLKIK